VNTVVRDFSTRALTNEEPS